MYDVMNNDIFLIINGVHLISGQETYC